MLYRYTTKLQNNEKKRKEKEQKKKNITSIYISVSFISRYISYIATRSSYQRTGKQPDEEVSKLSSSYGTIIKGCILLSFN